MPGRDHGGTVGRAGLSLALLLVFTACDGAKSPTAPSGAEPPTALSCTYTASPPTFTITVPGGTGIIDVSCGSTCNWTATSAVDWIVFSGNASGTGTGKVTFAASENRVANQRVGTVTVAGQTVTITQGAAAANPAPPSAALAMVVDSFGSTTAVQGLTDVEFDASGSTGDALTFSIDFGDGDRSTTAVSRHVYLSDGDMTARVTVTDSLGRTSVVEKKVVVGSIEYTFGNSVWNGSAGTYEYRTLQITNQSGAQVSGSYRHPDGSYTSFEGSLGGERNIALTLSDNTMTFTGNRPAGGIGEDCRSLTMLVKGGSADGMTLVFTR